MPAPSGQRLYILHRHSDRLRGAILYVHPFAEEMNKSRFMAGLQARALAAEGFAVLQVDLAGCGDSSGDFGDATWQCWIDDVVRAGLWLRSKCDAQLWLWGLRAGCLLGAAAAPMLGPDCHFLFWQPANSGKVLLQQFLRLKLASANLGGKPKASIEDLREALGRGESIEIAGYRLGAALAAGLEQASLSPPKGVTGRLEYLELSSRPELALSNSGSFMLDEWRRAGFATRARVVAGPAFWQTSEMEQAPALLHATCKMLGLESTS